MKPIRVLALIEATSITGPAKNLIEFASLARQASPSVEMIVATIRRPYHPSTDPFLDALKAQQIPCAIVREKSALDVSILGSLRELADTVVWCVAGTTHEFPNAADGWADAQLQQDFLGSGLR